MATAKDHYESVLSDVYVWMLGGFEAALKRNAEFFRKHDIRPARSGIAIDLGAGCGFQSIPLAQAGFAVTAIDMDRKLLNELGGHSADLSIISIEDDLTDFTRHCEKKAELIVCMTDTLLHLESKAAVEKLFRDVAASLEEGGKFVVTFRDLTFELSELDRFIPVKSDDDTIFTCFLEYEEHTVKVHDLVHKKEDGGWQLKKSFYRKLRLSGEWVKEHLVDAGFSRVVSSVEQGVVTVIAVKEA